MMRHCRVMRAARPHALLVGIILTITLVAALPRAGAQAAGRPPVTPAAARGALGPLPYVRQTWNNCGPASVSAVLAYWGIERRQADVQAVLRADGDPNGMAPFGVPAYARSLGLEALLGVGGSPALLKALISNGFPVIVNQWVSLTDRVRHYRPIEAYDDRRSMFVAADPYLGPDLAIPYATFARLWSVSYERFIVLTPTARAPFLLAVLASAGWRAQPAYRRDRTRQLTRLATGEVSAASPRDAHVYPYLNLAWDELQLGQRGAARRALDEAAALGANPIVLAWIRHEIH